MLVSVKFDQRIVFLLCLTGTKVSPHSQWLADAVIDSGWLPICSAVYDVSMTYNVVSGQVNQAWFPDVHVQAFETVKC